MISETLSDLEKDRTLLVPQRRKIVLYSIREGGCQDRLSKAYGGALEAAEEEPGGLAGNVEGAAASDFYIGTMSLFESPGV
jgi:hypothetical protein